ncbi:MAG TPA: peptidase [Elusimicrobia bacterium]|nr:peptidase [Elusimicrobiota bacterium]
MLERDLKKYAGLFSGYTELRLQENRSLDINLINGALVSNAKISTGGASARVYKKGSWGFSSAPGMDSESVEYCLRKAADNAAFLDSRQKLGSGDPEAYSCLSFMDIRAGGPRKTQKEIIEFLREVDRYIVASCKNLRSRRLWFGSIDSEKSLLTSDGSSVYSMLPRTRIIIYLSGEKDGKKADLRKILGAGRQFEEAFKDPAGLFAEIDALGEHLNKKLDGVVPDAGTWDCVLSPEMSGMLAHEAVGHTVEADHVLSGAVTRDLLGKTVASPLVSLTDFAYEAFGKDCPVPIRADDEGVGAVDAEIIKEGVLKSYLHNKESAARFRSVAAGNARASEFSDAPLIRMRNTAILPGSSKYEDMLASVDNGYLLLVSGDGRADSTGEFMFGVVVGYEIKRGRIGRAIKDTTVSGMAFDVLRSVSMVSDRFGWLNGGMCSKPQRVTVGMGGADIKCRVQVGGK